MSQRLLLAYFVLSLFHLFSTLVDNIQFINVTKPILLILLTIYFIVEAKSHLNSFRNSIIIALLLCGMGDVMFLFVGAFKNIPFLTISMLSFLTAHLFYIRGFTSIKSLREGYMKKAPIALLPYVLYFIIIVWALAPHLSSQYLISVILYCVIITLMAISAANLNTYVPKEAAVRLTLGGLSFLVSNSLIAFLRFDVLQIGGHATHSTLSMIFYLLAQYLLATGAAAVVLKDAKDEALEA